MALRVGLIAVDLTLRTRHLHYLEYLAEITGQPISSVLRDVLKTRMASHIDRKTNPAKKCRCHVVLEEEHVAFLDDLARKSGLQRSDAARRVIDDTISRDQTL